MITNTHEPVCDERPRSTHTIWVARLLISTYHLISTFSRGQIMPATIPAIVNFMDTCATLTKLSISHVRLTSRDVITLAPVLADSPNLTSLDLSNNNIGALPRKSTEK